MYKRQGHEVEILNDSKCVLTLDNGKTLELPTVAGGASVLQHVDVEMSDAVSYTHQMCIRDR